MFCGSSWTQTISSQVGIPADELGRLRDGKRIELLEPRDGDRFGRGSCLVADDVVVDLARAENESSHPLSIGRGIVEHRTERALCEVGERRRGVLQAQEPLRRQHDERPRGRRERLSAQQVEVLRGGRAVRDADVLLRGQLQEALGRALECSGPLPS